MALMNTEMVTGISKSKALMGSSPSGRVRLPENKVGNADAIIGHRHSLDHEPRPTTRARSVPEPAIIAAV